MNACGTITNDLIYITEVPEGEKKDERNEKLFEKESPTSPQFSKK